MLKSKFVDQPREKKKTASDKAKKVGKSSTGSASPGRGSTVKQGADQFQNTATSLRSQIGSPGNPSAFSESQTSFSPKKR